MFRPSLRFLLLGACCALAGGLVRPARAAEDATELTAVIATVYNGYERTPQADGSFAPETYSFGEGGVIGQPVNDKSIGDQPFRQIAGRIAPGMTRQNYVPSFDEENTQLLVLVFWGATGGDQDPSQGYVPGTTAIKPPSSVSISVGGGTTVSGPPPATPGQTSDQAAFDAMTGAANRQRDRTNSRNAHLLGYDQLLAQNEARLGSRSYLDVVDEIEDPRYLVVLRAFDFQLLRTQKKQKLLWEVRYSIRARGHWFDESLAAMTSQAAQYFGRDSNGLVRKDVPVGRVKMRDTEFEEYREKAETK